MKYFIILLFTLIHQDHARCQAVTHPHNTQQVGFRPTRSDNYVNWNIKQIGASEYVKRALPFGLVLVSVVAIFAFLVKVIFDRNEWKIESVGAFWLMFWAFGWGTRWMAQLENRLIGPNEKMFDIYELKNGFRDPGLLFQQAFGYIKQFYHIAGPNNCLTGYWMGMLIAFAINEMLKSIRQPTG